MKTQRDVIHEILAFQGSRQRTEHSNDAHHNELLLDSFIKLATALGHERKNQDAKPTPAELDEMGELILNNKTITMFLQKDIDTLKKFSFSKEQREAIAAFKGSTEAILERGKDENTIRELEQDSKANPKNKDANNKKIATLKQKPKPDIKQAYKDKIELAEAFGYKAKNPGLEPSQKELEEMGQIILKQGLDLTHKQKSFLNNPAQQADHVREADIYLADPAKLSIEQVREINTLLGSPDSKKQYQATQLMQGKEIDKDKTPNKEDLEQANKVMREFQKAVDKVAPMVSINKEDNHAELRNTAKAIGTNLRRNFGMKNIKEIAQSMARSMRNKLSSKIVTAASVVRAPKKETDKGQIR